MIFNFLENPYENVKIGAKKFAKFASKHLSALEANNDQNDLTDIIALVKNDVEEFVAWVGDKDEDGNESKSNTKNIDTITDDFETFMDDVWEEVNYKFGRKKPDVYMLCFPNGLNEYNNITRTNAPILIKRVADFCDKYKADLPAGMPAEAKKFQTDYADKQKEQEEGQSNVKDSSKEGEVLRQKLAKSMKTVLLSLLLKHKDNENEVLKYYDAETINYYKRTSKKMAEDKTPPPPAK